MSSIFPIRFRFHFACERTQNSHEPSTANKYILSINLYRLQIVCMYQREIKTGDQSNQLDGNGMAKKPLDDIPRQ